MSRLSDVLRELIESRGITEREYAQRIVKGGWEDDIDDTLDVLNDAKVPCHDILWATEVVLDLDAGEMKKLEGAASEDARECLSRGKGGMAGSAMTLVAIPLSAFILILLFFF